MYNRNWFIKIDNEEIYYHKTLLIIMLNYIEIGLVVKLHIHNVFVERLEFNFQI